MAMNGTRKAGGSGFKMSKPSGFKMSPGSKQKDSEGTFRDDSPLKQLGFQRQGGMGASPAMDKKKKPNKGKKLLRRSLRKLQA